MDLYNLVVSAKLTKGGGGGDIDVDELSVTENGVYTASSGHAYSPVAVSVPQSGITPTGTKDISANGVYDVTDFASASVSVPTGVFPSGTSSITSNGIYDITNFASVDVNVSGGGGGDHDAEDGIIMKTISGAYTNSRVPFIGACAFQQCSSLTAVNLQSVEDIKTSAFYYCANLTSINAPNNSKVGASAFYGCSNLLNVNMPKVSAVLNDGFSGCSKLTSVSFPECSSIGQNAFRNCRSMSYVNLPMITSIPAGAFSMCLELASAEAFTKVSEIGSSAFMQCSKLMSLYLLSDSVVTLRSNTAFSYTPIQHSSYWGSFGSIYVPASLVSDYKAASNWSYYADRITSYVE